MSRLIEFSESEACLPAEKRFIQNCQFDLSKPKHRRMMEMARKVREDGIDGIKIRAKVSFCEPENFHDGRITMGKETVTCNFFSQISDDRVKGIYLYMLTVGECYFSSEENIMDFLYADIWGSSYVDVSTDLLIERIKCDMSRRYENEEELWLTPEFGPGYFGMPVSETHKFYSILDGDEIGCVVKDSGLIIPQKSCTGLFFVLSGKELDVEPECLHCAGTGSGCAFCAVRGRGISREDTI